MILRKILFVVILLLLSSVLLLGKGAGKIDKKKKDGKMPEKEENPIVAITTSLGEMEFELFEDLVPNTVANFIQLAERGFYQDLSFHRVIQGFMAQGGCPYSKKGNLYGRPGTGGPGYCFDNECVPELRHEGRGILSMANAGPNTNGSQFFICFTTTPWLDGMHTVFGKMTKGNEVLDALEHVGSRSGEPNILVTFSVRVIRKRNHVYQVKKNSNR